MNLATIGRGFIVDRAIDALKDTDNLNLYAVYSRSQKGAEEFAQKHGAIKAYSDLDKMLEDEAVDIVYIASPNTLHYGQARKALEAGKHVILEKPFTGSLKQAEELFALAEEKGVMLFEAITTLHTENFKLFKEKLVNAGPVKEVWLDFSRYNEKFARYLQKEITNTFDPAMDGGALMDLNIYNLHLAAALFGRPDSLFYLPLKGYNGVDLSGLLVLNYPEFQLLARASMDKTLENRNQIITEQGIFRIEEGSVGRMNQVSFQKPGKAPVLLSKPHRNHMSAEFQDFSDIIQRNDQAAYRFWKEQTLLTAALLDQAKTARDA